MPLKPVNLTYKPLPRNVAQAMNHAFGIFPSPTKGLDAARPLVAQDPLTAGRLINWWCRRWGPELRGGYERWTTNLGGGVRSIMPYRTPPGSAGTFVQKLFAACDDGDIYDITAQTGEGATPSAAQVIGGQVNPGRFSYTNVTIAGTTYLAMVGVGGGYWTYDHAGGWVNRTANVTGVNAATFDHIMVWKNRIWFIQNDTTIAWYLPVDSIQGAANQFNFGPLFAHGGALAAMSSWTMDAGDGIDDRLVIVSTEGDVLVYAGTDPTSATTFGMIGRWMVGTVPEGRRFITNDGGDLALVTEQGIEYMSRLIKGNGLLESGGVQDSPAYRFNDVIGRAVKETRGDEFWTILYHPGEEALIIGTPAATTNDSLQFAWSSLSNAWSTFSGMPMRAMDVFEGELYFGDDDGKVYQAFTADTDDLLSDGTVGQTIVGDIQTAYVTDPKNPMSLKRPTLICPMFQAPAPPAIQAQVNTEWSNVNAAGSPAFSTTGGSLWNSSLWNTALWNNAEQAYITWLGAVGLGAYCSLSMRVAGLPGTIFTSWKLIYEPGGVM